MNARARFRQVVARAMERADREHAEHLAALRRGGGRGLNVRAFSGPIGRAWRRARRGTT